MNLKERIQALCKERNIPASKLEKDLCFGGGYISKLDKSTPNVIKIQKIADYFGISLSDLLGENQGSSPELTARDERDIAKTLDHLMEQIKNKKDGPLYYNGAELDDVSLEFLRVAYEHALRETKKENKVKYNPYKNKSEKAGE